MNGTAILDQAPAAAPEPVPPTPDPAVDALLDAGTIVLNPDNVAQADADERSDLLSVRSYTHPALVGRTVVRLVPEALGPAEDLAMDFLGFAAPSATGRVGAVRRKVLGFPGWVLVHDPEHGRAALALVKDFERLARTARSKPGRAKEGFEALAAPLAAATPHILPSFYEEAARCFLSAENKTTAIAMFNRAREAERAHGLAVDEDARAASFLEFALAGALSSTALRDYAKDLAERCTPAEAYERFRRICLERVGGGLPPYPAMPTDLRRLARAAGCDTPAEDAAVARELLARPATARAAAGFWTGYRPVLVRAAKHDPAVRGLMLGLLPNPPGEPNPAADDAWLELLEECGAAEALTVPLAEARAGRIPSEALPTDGATGWFLRFARHADRAWSWRTAYRLSGAPRPTGARLPQLLDRMAARLKEECATGSDGSAIDAPAAVPDAPAPAAADQPAGRELALLAWADADPDLVDQCLALGLPIAAPTEHFTLNLTEWLRRPTGRDLAALAAHPQLRPHLTALIDQLSDGSIAYHYGQHLTLATCVDRLTGASGLRSVLGDWLAALADRTAAAGLAELEELLVRWLNLATAQVAAAHPEAVRRVVELDVSGRFAAALRGGILDEYGWPALEQTAARLSGQASNAAPTPHETEPRAATAESATQRLTALTTSLRAVQWRTHGEWPYLIIEHEDRAVVVGPQEVVHQQAVAKRRSAHWQEQQRHFHYVDGRLLFARWERKPDGHYAAVAHWSDASAQAGEWSSDAPQRHWGFQQFLSGVSLELPVDSAGRLGRSYGGAALVPPALSWTEAGPVACDGTDFWVLAPLEDAPATTYFEPKHFAWYALDPHTGKRGGMDRPGFFTRAGNGRAGLGELVPEGGRLRPTAPGAGPSPLGEADGLLGWAVRRAADGALVGFGIDGRSVALPQRTLPSALEGAAHSAAVLAPAAARRAGCAGRAGSVPDHRRHL